MTVLQGGDLNGLNGWGSFTKKIRSVAKQAIAAPVALAVPTKKNVTAAVSSIKTAAPVAAAAAAVTLGVPKLAPVVAQVTQSVIGGSAGGGGAGGGGGTQYYDAAGNPISKDQYDAIMAQVNGQGAAAPAGQDAGTAAAADGSTPAPTTAKKGPNLLKWGAIGLLTAKAVSMVF